MSLRAARVLLLASLACFSLGCASAPKLQPAAPGGAAESCQDVEYRGVYRDAEHESGRRFRLKARVCSSGRVFAEIRGLVGGPGLVAAARPGKALLLFPKERLAIEGPDDPAFWLEWTGAPLSGALLVDLMRGRVPHGELLEGWRLEALGGDEFPELIRAKGPDRLGFELTRRDLKVAERPPMWPDVPPSFERRDARGS